MNKADIVLKKPLTRRAESAERLLSPATRVRFKLLLTGWPRARLILDGLANHITGSFYIEEGRCGLINHAVCAGLDAYERAGGMDICRFRVLVETIFGTIAVHLEGTALQCPGDEWDASYPVALSKWLKDAPIEDVTLTGDTKVSAEAIRLRLEQVALEEEDRDILQEASCVC